MKLDFLHKTEPKQLILTEWKPSNTDLRPQLFSNTIDRREVQQHKGVPFANLFQKYILYKNIYLTE